MSEDSKSDKKIYILVERASTLSRGVSRALWPATARRLVETSRAAQRRRARLMRRRVCPRQPLAPRTAPPRWLPRLFLTALVASSMLSGGTLVLAVLWHLWFLPLGAALALSVSLLALRARWPADLPSAPLPPQMSMDAALPASSSFGLPWKSLPGQPGAPETPMPDPPSLVRVLETFDLSRGELEPALTEVPWPPATGVGTGSEWGQRGFPAGAAGSPLPDELPCSSAGQPDRPGSASLIGSSPSTTDFPRVAVRSKAEDEPLEGSEQAQSSRSLEVSPREIEMPETRPCDGLQAKDLAETPPPTYPAAAQDSDQKDEGEKL
ncbi:hypothetical protein [Thermogemmatispora sp.]|uniref:hypothetical protein n=1 Tax=Thermogemmatispora sp. TaxID=1968838 RepID=UPI0035E3F6FE